MCNDIEVQKFLTAEGNPKSMKKKFTVGKIIVSVVLTILLFTAFTIPLGSTTPPLGKLLFPGDGVWDVPQKYPDQEKWSVEYVKDNIQVYRDNQGIPHIYGNDSEDIAFALGYVQAQDRLFQMDLIRRFATGQLSEVFGEGMLGNDVLSKTKLLKYYAEKNIERFKNSDNPEDQKFYEYFKSFSEGVNHYAETHPDEFPLEFALLNYEFEPWTPVDSMSVGYYMLEAGSWNYSDLTRLMKMSALIEEHGKKEGKQKFVELYGNPSKDKVRPYQVPICPGYGEWSDISAPNDKKINTGSDNSESKNGASDYSTSVLARDVSSLMGEINQEQKSFEPLEGLGSLGSNSWVVSGDKTKSGETLGCADSHEDWTRPNIYYEAHVVNSGNGNNFYGYYVPGGGGVAVDGHNQHVTWGMTRVYWDQVDWYYYEKVDENHYVYENEVREFRDPINIEIQVKGEEPRELQVKRTVHGPVFSDLGSFAPDVFENMPDRFDNKVLAARWYCHQNLDFGKALLSMSRAQDFDDFKEALSHFKSPPNNITYADDEGNIAAWCVGAFPIRKDQNLPSWHLGNGLMPYNGSEGEGKWGEMIDSLENYPHSINPEQDYLVASNQIPAGPEYKHPQPFEYREGYRARRINELLASGNNLTYKDMKEYQLDIKSIRAEDFTPHFLAALNSKSDKSDLEKQVYNRLSNWDYKMDKNESAPTIFKAWMGYVEEETFGDEWGKLGFDEEPYPKHPVLEELIRTDKNSDWFDDITTEDVEENATTIILQALDEALTSLENYYGTQNIDNWTWGEVHKIEFTHITGELDALNYGPIPISGSSNTVFAPHNNLVVDGEFNPTNSHHGSHHRLIVDYGDLGNSCSVLPGGDVGHYTFGAPYNQFDLFLDGGYHTEYFTATSPEEFLNQSKSLTSRIIFRRGENNE